MIKISVIIPVYNVEMYLRECLDSILNQTFSDFEIICVNDGATDSSLQILNEYARTDKRITVVNQKNSGPSVSRNKGIQLAKGEYIAFIDSDDYLLNNDYLEKLYNACEKHGADIAVASIIRGNDRKSVNILKIDSEKIVSDYREKLRICDVPKSNYVWNKLYKKSSWLNSGLRFPEGMLYEDIWLTHKILFYTGKLVAVPDIAYFYRKRQKSIVKTRSAKCTEDCKLAEKEMYRFFDEHNIDVSDYYVKTKKYKFLGITFFKTISKSNKTKNVLFNFIKWETGC